MYKINFNKLNLVLVRKVKDAGLVSFIIILTIVIQLRNNSFLSIENINDLIKNTAILSILSVGMMMVIITRGIDLSIGASLALVGMSVSLINSRYHNLNPIIVIIIGICIGTACGFLVGLCISKGKILPIIATLGLMNIFRGITFMISGGRWVSAHQMSISFKGIATGEILGINNLIVIAVVINLIFWYVLVYTRFGRQIYAVGSNLQSAKISGINVDKILLLVYVFMGALAGLAGVMWVSKFASAQGDTASGYELNVIAACVLGGVSIAGGVGKISNLLWGVLLLGILNNALPLINVSPFWQSLIQGLVILFAVLINVLIKRRVDFNYLKRKNI